MQFNYTLNWLILWNCLIYHIAVLIIMQFNHTLNWLILWNCCGQLTSCILDDATELISIDLLFQFTDHFRMPGQFTTFEFVKRNQQQKRGRQARVLPLPRQIPVATAGGAAAGLVGTLLSYPMQPVFDRLLLEVSALKLGLKIVPDCLKETSIHFSNVNVVIPPSWVSLDHIFGELCLFQTILM